MAEFYTLLYGINREVINPAIVVLMLVAIVVFVYGLLRFTAKMASPEERRRGRSSMVWGIVGLFIMVAVFAIIRLALRLMNVSTGALPF